MLAIELQGIRKLEIVQRERPRLTGPQDVLLKVEKVGICGSDVHYFETGRIGEQLVEFPHIVGHECSVTVAQVGAQVSRVRTGEPAAVDPAIACFQCDQCRAGREHTCREMRFMGNPGQLQGCLCEYVVMPQHCVFPIGQEMTLDQAMLCEPLSIGRYGLELSGQRQGTAAILGMGSIGLSVLLAGRSLGMESVYVTDKLEYRVELARRKGVTWAGNPQKEDIVAAVLDQQPQGIDVVYECAGQQETLDEAVELLKPGGKLVLVGIPREERVSFDISALRRKELQVINVRRQNHCVQPVIDAIAAGQVEPDFMVTHRFGPEQAQQAFELVSGYEDGVIKAVIEF